jgi:hypothetical protein
MSGKYDDIIGLPHHVSDKHPRMSSADRAAQFSPYAALTGFGAVISETGRLTEEAPELDDCEKEKLDGSLRILREQPEKRSCVAVTYFRPDERKSGGAYITVTGAVKKIDEYERLLLMSDGEKIPVDAIAALEIMEHTAD